MKTKSENAPAMDSKYMEDKYHTPSHCRHCKNITLVSLSQLKLLTSQEQDMVLLNYTLLVWKGKHCSAVDNETE